MWITMTTIYNIMYCIVKISACLRYLYLLVILSMLTKIHLKKSTFQFYIGKQLGFDSPIILLDLYMNKSLVSIILVSEVPSSKSNS